MINSRTNYGASCELRPLSSATRIFEPIWATTESNQNATDALRVSAKAAIRRNTPRNSNATTPKKSATLDAKKRGSELRKNERWLRWLDLLEIRGLNKSEIEAIFINENDVSDVLALPDSAWQKLATTAVTHVLRNRQPAPALNVHVFRRTPQRTCAACCHFERIEHPHLGHCAIQAHVEAVAGLWDTDHRDYCHEFAEATR